VWAWGYNAFGQLGDATTTNRSTPVSTANLSGVTGIAAGGHHTLAARGDGTAWAWGRNSSGELGDGTTTDRITPVQVQDLTPGAYVNGVSHHCLGVMDDGPVGAWGTNGAGQLGDGTTTARTAPVQVQNLSGATAIAAGGRSGLAGHNLALLPDGTVRAWGHNNEGQLGDGTRTSRTTPVAVSGLTNVVAIAADGNSSYALKGDGTVWAWGDNSSDQLANSGVNRRATTAVQSNITDVVFIAAGAEHALAIKSDGTAWAWGRNNQGQLGNGGGGNPNSKSAVPVQVASLTDVEVVAGGHAHSLARIAAGSRWGWGLNNFGQLGDATISNSSLPVKATIPPAVTLDHPQDGAALTGVETLRATVTDGDSVSVVEFLADGELVGSDDAAPYSFAWDTTTLEPGPYTIRARVNDGAGNVGLSEPAGVTVEPATPIVVLDYPQDGATLTGVEMLQATVTNGDSVAAVQFLVDGEVVGAAEGAPFSFAWDTTSAAPGPYAIQARATDGTGAVVAVSEGANITVENEASAPIVTLDYPQEGAILTGIETLQATVTDGDSVAAVQFLVDGEMVGSDDSAPYSFAWDTTSVAPGPYTVQARATDGTGTVVAVSDTASVTVENDAAAPTVTLDSPVAGSTLFHTETLTATAASEVGVAKVEFMVDEAVIGEDETAPYSFDWDTSGVADGSRTLSARVWDTWGNSAMSSTVSVTVGNSLPSSERVHADFEQGELTTDAFVRYGMYAMANASLLPSRYQSDSLEEGSASIRIYEFLAEWDNITEETRQHVLDFFTLQEDDGDGGLSTFSTTSSTAGSECDLTVHIHFDPAPLKCRRMTENFRILYTRKAVDPVHGVTTAFVDRLAESLENAHSIFTGSTTGQMGYRSPVGRTDVIVRERFPWSGGLAMPFTETITIDQDANMYEDRSIIEAVDTIGLAPHELFHIIQYQYVPWSDVIRSFSSGGSLLWWMEASAAWAAHKAAPANTSYMSNLPLFLGEPSAPLTAASPGNVGKRHYGAFIFAQYLEESLARSAIRQSWERLSVPGTDVVQAIGDVMNGYGREWAGELARFAEGNYRLGTPVEGGNGTWRGFYSDPHSDKWRQTLEDEDLPTKGDDLGSARPARQRMDLELGQTTSSGGAVVQPGGSSYLDVKPQNAQAGTLTFDIRTTVDDSLEEEPHARFVVLSFKSVQDGVTTRHEFCDRTSVPMADGTGSIAVELAEDCSFATLVAVHGDPASGRSLTAKWTVSFNKMGAVCPAQAGIWHALAIKEDGSLWAWGWNGSGALGDGSRDSSTTPVQVEGMSDVVEVAAGSRHSVALKDDGSVWAWGSNTRGQLGIGDPGDDSCGTVCSSTTPVAVNLTGTFTAVASGEWHSLALRDDGTVWAWGENGYGQLGDGTSGWGNDRFGPVQVSGIDDAVAIFAGPSGFHSFARLEDGTVMAWGSNFNGELGVGSSAELSAVPLPVVGPPDFRQLQAGGPPNSIGLHADGRVSAWGYQVDDTWPSVPVTVEGAKGVVGVSAGGEHYLAARADGRVYAWGFNMVGEIGDGTQWTWNPSPGFVRNPDLFGLPGSHLFNVACVSAGDYFSLAVKRDGTLLAWGWNDEGQLGNGSTDSSSLPVPVAISHVRQP
jgi:alpha-tubulin suppressor-like RCC1 family protein